MALTGLKILVPEARELDLFASMLETEGAKVLRCPLVRILDLEDRQDADLWIDRFVAGEFEELVILTGEGLRRLLGLSKAGDRKDSFISALRRVRTTVRGPKPVRVLRELGLSPTRTAPSPTSRSVLDLLAREPLAGRKIAVQLYPGDGALPLLAGLRERGAEVAAVTPYRYASQAETGSVAQAIRDMAAGRIDVVAFTSSPQVERVVAVARETGLEKQLREGLVRVRIASIGPIVDETLRAHGLAADIRPETSFHLKPLVRAIASAGIVPGESDP